MTPEQERLLNEVKERMDKFESSNQYSFDRLVRFEDGKNIQTGRTTGTKFGTATDQKLSFHGVTPVVQAGAISSPAAEVGALKTAVDAIRVALTNNGTTG
ncbi:MAG TPA: hypothetical protein ENI23_11225 [bacterium]|nr:hypothetical protein [bacterium]